MTTACENPFRTSRLHALEYRLAGVSWEQIMSRLAGLGYRAAVVGAHGHGKSTFLRALGPRIEELGLRTHRLFLNEERPRFDSGFLRELAERLTPSDVILLDGCEQLGWWAWRRFMRITRRAGGLIVTVHTPGRLPALYECRTSPDLLADLMRALDAESWGGDDKLIERLFDRHQGNIRDVFFALYDRMARGEVG
ncbi:MAG: hypothetical protein HZB26_02175 [Candidatus Hydrogenedentes bacterium]|nr:hypothetical protein [Candidatus Hydrogenedentota bacterium]